MNIAVTATGGSIEAKMDERFGRCKYFVVVDSETMKFHAFMNPNTDVLGGAGPAAAAKIAEIGAEVLITGHVGVNAQQALDAAGIRVVTQNADTVREAVEAYLKMKN